MGLSFELYAGNPDAIAQAFSEAEFEKLAEHAELHVDLSLHISLDDLDLLSHEISSLVQVNAVLLTDALGDPIATLGDDEGHAPPVDPAWIEMTASVPAAAARDIATAWIRRIAEDRGEPLDVHEDTVRAIQALLLFCKDTLARRLPVTLCWNL